MQNQKRKMTAVIELPISNKHGVPVLEDFLAEIQRRCQAECDIKNNLYSFCVSKGILDEYSNWRKKNPI